MEEGMNPAIEYHQWKEEYKSTLKTFYDKNVLVLFSGGKDSSLAMDFLLRAKKTFGFDFKAHAGAYPVHRYPDTEKKRIESYWNKRGIEVQWHDLGKTDDYIKNEINPCLKCQKLRKKMLKTILGDMVDDWESLVLVTGYSLWDIVSYSIEHILNDLFSNSINPEDNKRFIETAQRFYPLLRMKEGYTVFRPLIKYNSNSIKKVITQDGIPTLSISCKFKEFRPKRILESYYQNMGIYFDYDKVFDFARRSLNLPDIVTYTSIDRDEYLLNIF
jgi:tRNA(Ile)-lysidine synthase TilS/MesJ